MPGNIHQNYQELRKKNSCRGNNLKSLAISNDEEGSEEDPAKIANICIMAIRQTSEVRIPKFPNCYDL